MLKKQMKQLIEETIKPGESQMELFKEEIEFARKHELLSSDIVVVEKEASFRFSDAYIERSDKETEQSIAQENVTFLKQPIEYFKKHKNEFMYVEADSFELIGVDSISLELDDVFKTYNIMLGLKIQKKMEPSLKKYLNENLSGEGLRFGVIFSQGDGLWDVNFSLNYVDGFREDMSISEAYNLVYRFIAHLVEEVEESK